MDDAIAGPSDAPMRSDARRNRVRLLDATVALVLEVGGAPPRDAVAARAGVGIGTLYRHFPDQQDLLRATALHVLDRTIDAGELALSEEASGADALRRYMHAAVDVGLGAVNIIHPLLDDNGWPDRRARAAALLDGLLERARRDGAVGSDVSPADIALAVIRFCRPLAIGIPPADERSITHGQIDIFLDGLAAQADR
jgi:AcrR family transcriptional regulator